MSVSLKAAVKPLLPVTIPQGNIRYAPGVRAGRWVFATGHKAVRNFAGPIMPEVVRAGLPGWDRPKLQREAAQIFRNVETVMRAGGTELRNVVRVDQNYTVPRAVELYHDVRRAVMKDHIPPSTSTLAEGLLLKDQEIEVHMLGVVPGPGFRPLHIRPKDQEVHASSGYSLALAAGDFVFIAGRMADGLRFGEGLAAEARMPEGHLWKGMPIRLEAEVILKRKIEPALKAAGSSLANVVKLQVYLRDVNDFAPLNQVLNKYFPRAKPAVTLIPTATPGFFLTDARIEINAIALRDGGRTRKRIIDAVSCRPSVGTVRPCGRATCCSSRGCSRSTAMVSLPPHGQIRRSRTTAPASGRRCSTCSGTRRSSAARRALRSRMWCACSSTTPISTSSRLPTTYGRSIYPASICRSLQ